MRYAAAALIALLAWHAPAAAQGLLQDGFSDDDRPAIDEPDHGDRSDGVFHGNYCGVGDNGPGLPPVDGLDAACMHHDACTPEGGIPTCGCNARFKSEVHAVAQSPRQPSDLRILARIVESSVAAIPCKQ